MVASPQLPSEIIQGAVILIDKPIEWTSFDIIRKIKSTIRHSLGEKKVKVGHAGTLDPLASGLLIICTGAKTREIESFQNQHKEYTGIFHVGATTPSGDLETMPDKFFPVDQITEKLILETSKTFIGEICQVPPLFSAKKIDGKRAYEHARKGDDITLAAKKIHIYDFEITKIHLPEISFRVVCSKGTYIRSLATDFGAALNSGAYLKELRRTKIGEYNVSSAMSPEAFGQLMYLNNKTSSGNL